jgi:raffinose/stachyose/melibiose transport system substrate-binding protein
VKGANGKKAFLLLLLLTLAVGLVACRGDEKTSGDSGTVELTFWNIWTEPSPENNVFLKKVEEFQKQNPHIKIKMESIPHDQYKIKLKTQAAGKQLPDLVQVWPGAELKPLVDAKVIMPLDDIVDHWKDKLIPAKELVDYQIDGKQYAIPGNKVYTSVIYYDKEMLKKVGYEKFPKTYGEFKNLIKKLREAGITPISLGNKGKWVLQSCYMSTIGDRITGSDFLSKALKGEKKFTDPEFVQALSVIKELKDLGAFNEDMNSIDNIQQRDYFVQGKAAMMIEGTWALGPILEKLPKGKEIGVAAFPAIEGGKGNPDTVSGVTGIGIALNSELSPEKKKAAYTFLKFFYDEDLYKQLLSAGSLVPAKVDLPKNLNPLFKEEIELTSRGTAPVYDATLPVGLTDIINNGLQAITIGSMTPEQLAEEMQKGLNR